MKNLITLVGIVLIIAGIGIFAYKGYHYTTREQVAQLGDIQVTAEKEKVVYLSPALGGISIVVGLVLVVVGRSGRIQ
jgi:hypothetical protein